jgi:CRISPR system Cascade subunit CasC
MFIDIHIIQTIPFSNLNRDDNGSPKTVVYGGALRARVSSQSWKRAARLSLEKVVTDAKTYRTRRPDNRLAEILKDKGIDGEEAKKIASDVFRVLGTKKEKDVVGLFSEKELVALSELAIEHAKELAELHDVKDASKSNDKLRKILTEVVSAKRPTTIALFGRMLADNPSVSVDAAMQVAHAFSVNEIDVEDDYFVATEDLPNPDDGPGGAYTGYAEFVSATFYRYATLDFDELVANCNGDVDAATELAAAGLLAFCRSLPSAKNNVTAPHSLPDMVNIVVRRDRPVSYAAALESPIRASNEGYALPACKKLGAYASRVNRMISEDPVFTGVVTMLTDEATEGLGERHLSLDKLVDEAVRVASEAS